MMNKRAFITAHKAQYPVATFCRLSQISRGWFYGFLASQPARNQRLIGRDAWISELRVKIMAFFKPRKTCHGSKRIHPLPGRAFKECLRGGLLADGELGCKRRVAGIMWENRMSPRLTTRKKPVTTDRNHKMSPFSKPPGARVPLPHAQRCLAG